MEISIVTVLKKERILEINMSEDKTKVFLIQPSDFLFSVELDKKELEKLIEELMVIKGDMKDI